MGHVISTESLGKPNKPGKAEDQPFAVHPVELLNNKQAMNAVTCMRELYGCSRDQMLSALARGYAEDAIFSDHFVWHKGHERILANNLWWTRVFSNGAVGPTAVLKLPHRNPKITEDNYVLALDHTGNCRWDLAQKLGFTYCYYATAYLTVRKADGKIIEHVDVWHNVPVMPPQILRWLLSLFLFLLMVPIQAACTGVLF